MSNLTIFANFRINDVERFQRMKDSFDSFCNIDALWILNIRGLFSLQAADYIHSGLGKKCQISHYESTEAGWKNDSLLLAHKIKTKYVFLWIEDHVSLVENSIINEVVDEMESASVDYLNYTWYFPELYKQWYGDIEKSSCQNIHHFTLTKELQKRISQAERPGYIISLPSIFSFSFFIKLLSDKRPYFRRWPKETPFDFEKNPTDFYILPVKMAILKIELFACIDDDNGVQGYSLHSRGLYSKRELRSIPFNNKKSIINTLFSFLFPLGVRHFIKRITYHF
jgi:hypothetical protein